MRLPLELVLRRGVVFLWVNYDQLDDPSFASRTKSKYAVILSASSLDDPVFYLLTTSEKPKHEHFPFPGDLFRVPAGSYEFLSQETLVDVGEAGDLEVGRAEFGALYENGEVVYKGILSSEDIERLLKMMLNSRRVSRRFKQVIQPL